MYGICSFSEGIHISGCAREMYQTHSKVEHFATVERPILAQHRHSWAHMGQIPQDRENGQNVAFLLFFQLFFDQTV